MHQAAGLQHDLAELGYSQPSTWSICAAALPGDDGGNTSVGIKCPIAGVGKQDIVATEPGSVELAIARGHLVGSMPSQFATSAAKTLDLDLFELPFGDQDLNVACIGIVATTGTAPACGCAIRFVPFSSVENQGDRRGPGQTHTAPGPMSKMQHWRGWQA